MVSLRPYTADDVAFARAHLYGPHAGDLQWFGYSSPRLQADFEANGLLTPDGGRLVVDEGGEPVGSVQWFKDSWGPPRTSWCWEIGIVLRADARGRGLGTQGQVLLRDYLFAHTQASTDVENLAEQRALEKAGFMREGRLRSAQWRAGTWHDQLLYARVRGDQ